ncbi:MAG: ketoacyl-ACP synthase III [Clostridiales bacterium]|jgi:3-oxoacyl-[acyl-carrier-protein] synthase-3|nr:ketoacyl-ACP synthase III [Clostridiales bacterium]
MGIQIISTGSYLPDLIITNDELSNIINTSDHWITSRTGVKQRHIATVETTAELGIRAAEAALERSRIPKEGFDLLVCATMTPNARVPMISSTIKKALKIKNAVAFDINAASSSFVYAISVAFGMMKAFNYKNAIVVGSDTMSQIVDWQDRTTCVLFGDGAGAVVLSRTDRNGIISTCLHNSIDEGNALSCDHALEDTPFYRQETDKGSKLVMDGQSVMRFAIDAFEGAIKAVLYEADKSLDEIKLFIPHQSNSRILKTLSGRMDIPENKLFLNIEKAANTASASIPIALDEAVNLNLVNRGDLILLVAYGGGFSSGAVLLEW